MATATLSVAADRTEYSPYYPAVRTITILVTTTTQTIGATVTCSLFREDGYGVLLTTKTATLVGDKAVLTFDTRNDALDADRIFRAAAGNYHINAVVSDNVNLTARSATFRIAPVSVAELKATTLKGIDFVSSSIVAPRQQPRNITGVTIVDVATTAQHDAFVLAFTNATKQLAWDGGTGVTVATTGINRYLLLNSDASWWVEVEVVGELLPTTDQTDTIFMDYLRVTDSDIQQVADNIYGTLQGTIQVPLEPRELNTDGPGHELNTGEHIDHMKEPLAYYKMNFSKNWFSVKFPTSNILKVWRLDGYFQSSRSLSVDVNNWVVKNGKSAVVEFVPRYGSVLLFQFFGVPFFVWMDRFEHIPSFWHYRLTAGLPDLDQNEDRQRVRTALIRWITIEVLAIAGQTSTPGVMGESTSRDGVSESRTYVQAAGGRYGNQIMFHSNFLFGPDGTRGEVDKLRDKFVGVMMVIL